MLWCSSEPSPSLPPLPGPHKHVCFLRLSFFFFSCCPSLEFHGLDEATLLRALQALQQEHKAEIITLDDARGVKFF